MHQKIEEKIEECKKKNNNTIHQKKEENIESEIGKRKSMSTFADRILLKKKQIRY